ncbi:MAG: hypothetical protein ABUL53_11245, partial [Bradyrhizobium guangdongense]
MSVACLLAFPDVALAQSKSPSALAPAATAAATATWDPSLPGKWTYRSYVNRAEVMVWDAPTSQ